MPSFQPLFTRSRGKPIVYKGQTLVMMDELRVPPGGRLRLTFETVSATWRQGVYLTVDDAIIWIGAVNCQDGAVLWQDTAPRIVDIDIQGRGDVVTIRNIWDVGNGVMHSWHNGAAMIVEEIPNGRRYRCNDGYADEDFDDIVFRIEALPEKSPPKQKIAHKLASVVRKIVVVEGRTPDAAKRERT